MTKLTRLLGASWAVGLIACGCSSTTNSGFGIPQTESASELGWAFFKKYAW